MEKMFLCSNPNVCLAMANIPLISDHQSNNNDMEVKFNVIMIKNYYFESVLWFMWPLPGPILDNALVVMLCY